MRTLPTLSERIKHDSAFILPYVFLGLLFLLNIVAMPVPVLGGVEVPFLLIAIYYWAMYRPALIPAWLLFCSGIVVDLISAVPLGLNAVIYVIMGWVISRKRRFLMAQSFRNIWLIFGISALVMMSARWLLFSATSMTIVSYQPVIYSVLSAMILFPIMNALLHLTHRLLPMGARK